jgi:hypothetical protein
MIDSFHCSGNSSLFEIELISLWIPERIVLPPALISSAGILSIRGDLCLFSFSIASQPQRHWAQALVALLYVFQFAEHS